MRRAGLSCVAPKDRTRIRSCQSSNKQTGSTETRISQPLKKVVWHLVMGGDMTESRDKVGLYEVSLGKEF